MPIEHSKAPSRLSAKLARQLNELYGPCIECEECYGLCPALIEALMLPDAILNRRTGPQ
jgi:ferredoxin